MFRADRILFAATFVVAWALDARAFTTAPTAPSAFPSASHGAPLPQAGRYNVLLIVLDDLGTDQLRFYGADQGPPPPCASAQVYDTPTPMLEVLRATGVMYSRAYVTPLCSPSRANFLTGRYGMRTGIGSAIERGNSFTLPSSEIFLSELIRDHNPRSYARGAFGKWHVADILTQDAHAAQNGFERFQGTKGNLDDHYTWRKVTATGGAATGGASSSAETIAPTGAPSEETYVASVTRRDAATWINEQTRPFFALVGFNPPHIPFQTPPPTLLSKATRTKLASLGYEPGERAAPPDVRLLYHAAIEAVDREIFHLLLAIAGKLPRTIVIVIGDNGTPVETVEDPTLAGHVKRSLHELGTRVPLIISGPLSWMNAGETCRELVAGVDLWRTIANLTGIPDATIDVAVAATGLPNDSLSFLDLIRDPQAASHRRFAYSELFANGPPPVPATTTWLRGMTDGTYRYIRRRLGTGQVLEQYFHVLSDECERADLLVPPHVLTAQEQAALAALRAEMDSL